MMRSRSRQSPSVFRWLAFLMPWSITPSTLMKSTPGSREMSGARRRPGPTWRGAGPRPENAAPDRLNVYARHRGAIAPAWARCHLCTCRSAARADPRREALPDSIIFAIAQSEGRVIVTENVDDFLEIEARYRKQGPDHAGLILTTNHRIPRSRPNHI